MKKIIFYLGFIFLLSCNYRPLTDAETLYLSGDFEEAKQKCEEILTKTPDDINSLELLSLIEQENGNHTKAGELLDKAIKLNPTNQANYLLRGISYFQSGDYENAENYLKESLKHDRSDFRTFYNLGQVMVQRSKFRESVFYYTKAIDLNPTEGILYQSRAISYEDIGEFDKAIEDYTKAIDLQPENCQAYFLRGFVYLDKGNESKACSDFSKSKALNCEESEQALLNCTSIGS